MKPSNRQDDKLPQYLNKLLDDMPLLEPSAEFTRRVMQQVEGGPVPILASKRIPRWRGEVVNGSVAIAATFVFISTGIVGKIVAFDSQIAQLSLYIEKLSRLIS
ncbi:hypothetical protein B5M42_019920 [Paenibacillus athensensis]|uniref:Uncharacterized protein n=1 Tax=Paenibacillus athensensis TaxID=1967502 RepID=A0A4Y8Q045_9BACL|nr:hypothetical protein [Paenibacillus athensensis]MCD1261075.1 hypothetical protein [Paenibacillus athensensis]